MAKEYEEKVKRAYTRADKPQRNQIASFNMQKSSSFNIFHNTDIRPDYAIGGGLEYNKNATEALELKQKIINEAKEAYFQSCKAKNKKFQAKSYEWSAVVNIKPNTTMKDLEKLTQHFLEKYGFQCYQIAIHRDEGHFNDEGEKLINHHAHLEFITLDRQTGKNRQRDLSPKILREIQTEVAQILGMQRGIDKRISGVKRIEPRKYAQMKEKEKETLKELKQELSKEKREKKEGLKECFKVIEQFRKDCIGNGYTKDFYDDLSRLKKDKEKLKEIINDPRPTKKLLKETLKTLAETHKKALKEKDKEIEELKEKLKLEKELNEDKRELIGRLSQENEALKKQLNQNNAKNAKEPLNDLKGEDLEKITGLAIEKLDKKLKGFLSNDTVIVKEEDRQKSLKEFNDAYDILSRLNPEKLKEWKQKKENLNYRSSLENYKKKPLHGQGIKTYDGFSKHLPEHLKHKPQSQETKER